MRRRSRCRCEPASRSSSCFSPFRPRYSPCGCPCPSAERSCRYMACFCCHFLLSSARAQSFVIGDILYGVVRLRQRLLRHGVVYIVLPRRRLPSNYCPSAFLPRASQPHTPAPAARMQSAARMYIPFDLKKLFLLNELSIISASFLRVRCHGVFSFLFLTAPPRFMRKAKFMKNIKIKKRKDVHLSVNVLP